MRSRYVSGPKVFVVCAQLSLLWLAWYVVASGTGTATSVQAWMDYQAGVEAAQAGDYVVSIELLDRATQSVPQASNAYLVRACSHARLGDIEAAVLALRDGIAIRLPNLTTPPCWDELLNEGVQLAFADFVPIGIVVPDELTPLESLALRVVYEGQENRDATAVLAGAVCLHSEQGLDQLADAYFVRLAQIVSEESVGNPDIIDCVDRYFERTFADA